MSIPTLTRTPTQNESSRTLTARVRTHPRHPTTVRRASRARGVPARRVGARARASARASAARPTPTPPNLPAPRAQYPRLVRAARARVSVSNRVCSFRSSRVHHRVFRPRARRIFASSDGASEPRHSLDASGFRTRRDVERPRVPEMGRPRVPVPRVLPRDVPSRARPSHGDARRPLILGRVRSRIEHQRVALPRAVVATLRRRRTGLEPDAAMSTFGARDFPDRRARASTFAASSWYTPASRSPALVTREKIDDAPAFSRARRVRDERRPIPRPNADIHARGDARGGNRRRAWCPRGLPAGSNPRARPTSREKSGA